mgnify:CR=1 FL=1
MEFPLVCYYYICMSSYKTNKLKCIITGRQLIATKDYYARKVEKAGNEEKLHETYICRDAKNLLKQGVSIDRIREILESDMSTVVDDKVLEQAMAEEKFTRLRRINNIVSTSKSMSIKTDPLVKEFINNIVNE